MATTSPPPRRSARLLLKLSVAEKAQLAAHARAAKLSMNAFVRMRRTGAGLASPSGAAEDLPASREGEHVQQFVIPASPDLDPVRVIAIDTAPSKGTLIIECYSEAWAASSGAMSGRTLLQFIASVDRHYLGSRLGPHGHPQYRERIANAVILAARERTALTPTEGTTDAV